MNQQQKNYALNRITQIRAGKFQTLELKFTTPEVRLSSEKKYRLIWDGKVKPYPITNGDHYLYYGKVKFDFSKLESNKKIDHEALKKAMVPIDALAQKAKDQIMLGDCEEAIKLIQQLEDIKV